MGVGRLSSALFDGLERAIIERFAVPRLLSLSHPTRAVEHRPNTGGLPGGVLPGGGLTSGGLPGGGLPGWGLPGVARR